MDENKMIKIMAALTVVIALGGGIFAYHTHQVNAQEAVAKQELMVSIDQQKAQETAAQAEKANQPVVDQSHPARYEVPVDQTPGTNPSAPTTQANSAPKAGSTAPQPIPQQTPSTTTTPPAQPAPKVNQDTMPAITSLSNADIQRLQSYPTYGSAGQGFFESFSEINKASAEAIVKDFTPATLSVYNKAKVGWLTSPKLVYSSLIGQYCVRGILTLTYYGDNQFGLTPNIMYQREAEYRLESSVQAGSALALNSIHYLSDWQAVK